MSQYGGSGYQNPVTDTMGRNMEPPRLNNQPPYMQRFVAGPARLESNPLSEPMRNFKGSNSPPKQQNFLMADYDLKNPDVQYERYKNLMTHQYYNTNANSANLGINMTGAHTVYQQPPQVNNVSN